jgi:hypothetical protein
MIKSRSRTPLFGNTLAGPAGDPFFGEFRDPSQTAPGQHAADRDVDADA